MKDCMKKIMTGLIAASCITTGAFASGQSDIAASGSQGTIEQAYENIVDIMISDISDFTIVQGNAAAITVNGDQAYIDSLDLTNVDGYLQINGEGSENLDLVITTPSFSSLFLNDVTNGEMSGFDSKSDVLIKLSGDTDLAMKETLNAPNVRIIASSKSSLEGEVATSSLDVRTSGASDVVLSGITEMFNVNMSQTSTGNFDGLQLQKGDLFTRNDAAISAVIPGISLVKVVTTNDSSVNLTMNGILRADARGDSSLTYSGDIRWAGQDIDEDASISAN